MFDIKSFYEAKDVADAINALVKNPDAEIISGGTDVLIRVREGKDAGRSVVSIHNIEALKGVRLLDNGGLWIGAGTAFSHITNDALIQKYIPMRGTPWTWWADHRYATPEPSAAISATAPPRPTPLPPCGHWRQMFCWRARRANAPCRSANSIQAPAGPSASGPRSVPVSWYTKAASRAGAVTTSSTARERPWR